jgi:hypothetical protein
MKTLIRRIQYNVHTGGRGEGMALNSRNCCGGTLGSTGRKAGDAGGDTDAAIPGDAGPVAAIARGVTGAAPLATNGGKSCSRAGVASSDGPQSRQKGVQRFPAPSPARGAGIVPDAATTTASIAGACAAFLGRNERRHLYG